MAPTPRNPILNLLMNGLDLGESASGYKTGLSEGLSFDARLGTLFRE